MRRFLVLLPPFAWLLALVAAPVAILAGIALSQGAPGVPPFLPPVSLAAGWQGTLENILTLVQDGYYAGSFLRSLVVAGVSAALCLGLAYPVALGIAAAREGWRVPLLAMVLLPFWTGFLPRLGAWIGLLRDGGWVNGVLTGLGVTAGPLPLLYSDAAMYLGMVHAYLPFAVLPLTATLLRRDLAVEEAAADLGASPWVVFRTVTLPLSLPGAAAAFLLVFIPAAGEFVIPELLGPPEALLVGRVLWAEFFQNRDWPLAAALAVALLVLLIAPIRLFQRLDEGGSRRGASPPSRVGGTAADGRRPGVLR
ncbi:ABC transporter permease [Dankookia rubra]|uniref:ABC transporter permease n=1 Tax=Dankookia rubra TaxID=1442381 RepID=A0A4R5QJ93_9PROT|nr:ABC transporter permease [Dankookia rubra]TDH63480.1 ABC transporter permease [Dankookia rubra]